MSARKKVLPRVGGSQRADGRLRWSLAACGSLAWCFRLLFAQDPHFSQVFMCPMLLNPAQTGAACDRLYLQSRLVQWPGVTAPYHTSTLAWDKRVLGYSGIGAAVTHDEAGPGIIRTTMGSLFAAFGKKWSGDGNAQGLFSRFGIEGGFIQKSLNVDRLTSRDQIDRITWQGWTGQPSSDLPVAPNVFRWHVSAGAVIEGDINGQLAPKNFLSYWFVGGAVHHMAMLDDGFSLLQGNNESFNRDLSALPPRYVFSFGLRTEPRKHRSGGRMNDSFQLFGVWMKQAAITQFNVGGTGKHGSFIYGARIRLRDAFIANVAWSIDRPHTTHIVGFSYDVTYSHLKVSAGGAFELTWRVEWDCGGRLKSMPCAWDPFVTRGRRMTGSKASF